MLDASTFISALTKPDSVPERAVFRSVQGDNRLLISKEIEDEYREVLSRPKFDRLVSVARRDQVFNALLAAANRIEAIEPVKECGDPKDEVLSAGSEWQSHGDRHWRCAAPAPDASLARHQHPFAR